MGYVLLAAIGLSVLVLAIIKGRKQVRRRASLLRLAHAERFEYAATDIFDDRWEPFRLFAMGEARGIRNVVYGTRDDIPVRAFDYWYRWAGDRRGSGVAFSGWRGLVQLLGITRRFSCAVAGVPAACPDIVVEPKRLADRVTELVAPQVPLESEAFNRRFHVRCENPRFAVAFLDVRVMDALLAMPGPVVLAVSEDRMLLVTHELKPVQVLKLLQEVSVLAAQVPRVLSSMYPVGPGLRPLPGTHSPEQLFRA